MINYLIYKLGIFLALHTSRKTAYKIARLLADIHFFISKKDRGAVIDNLNAIFNTSGKENFRIARRMFRNFAKYLVDFFRFSKMGDNFIKEFISTKDIEHMDNALRKGRGAIMVSAHLGNWELGGAVMSKLGYPTNVVALDHKNKLINNFFINQRSMMGVNVISIGMALRKCFVALKRNQVLGLLGDRDFSTHGVWARFLGKDALIPRGPATFSLKSSAPIVPGFLLRNPDDTFSFLFEKEIDYQTTGNFEQDLITVTEKIIVVLENYIKKYPDQWYMFRRFWL